MAIYTIRDKDNNTVKYTGAPRYNGVFGKTPYIEFQDASFGNIVGFQIGDYCDYDRVGLRFKLYSLPQPTRKSANNTSGEAIVYKSIILHAAPRELEICPFKDIVMSDNTVHFSSQQAISTYENVYGIASRIQANLDSFYGSGKWNINVYEPLIPDATYTERINEVKNFTFSGRSCMDALNQIYSLWKGIGWIFTVVDNVNTILIGRPNIQDIDNTTGGIFSFGKGNGLKVLSTAISEQNSFASRLYVYGSTRNMISRYYNKLTPAIKDNTSVHIPNLMIPQSYWGSTSGQKDASKAYLQAGADVTAKYGIIPKDIYFDGSDDNEEIYPSIEKMTAGTLRAAIGQGQYAPSASYTDDERMDAIKSATAVSDDGIAGTDGKGYVVAATKTVSQAITVNNSIIQGQSIAFVAFGQYGSVAVSNTGGKGMVRTAMTGSIRKPQELFDYFIRATIFHNGVAVKTVDMVVTSEVGDYITFKFPDDVQFVYNTPGDVSIGVQAELQFQPADAATTIQGSLSSGTVTYYVSGNYASTFNVALKQIGFDLSLQQSALSSGLCTLEMKSGKCGGRSFVVNKCTYDSVNDAWNLTCTRQLDDSLGQYFPNSIYPISAGDYFVLTDLEMPAIYVTNAEQRLYNAGLAALARMSKPKLVYTPELDPKYMHEMGRTLREGLYLVVSDNDIIPTELGRRAHTDWVLIDSVTITENESPIPIYKITLRDEKEENFFQRITGEIDKWSVNDRLSSMWHYRRTAGDAEVAEEGIKKVYILADQDYFSYANNAWSPSAIMLTCITENIPSPTYQWQKLNGNTWDDIAQASGGQNQALKVLESDFPSGSYEISYRCNVTYDEVETYSSDAKIIRKVEGEKGADAVSISLEPPALIIEGDTEKAIATNIYVTPVVVRGGQVLSSSVDLIESEPDGITHTISQLGMINFRIGNSLTDKSGTIDVTISASGVAPRTIALPWILVLKGEKGDDGYNSSEVSLYRRSINGAPDEAPNDLLYNFGTGVITEPTIEALNGWSQTIPTTNPSYPIYVIKANVRSRLSTATIVGGFIGGQGEGEGGDWSDPVRLTGDNGLRGKVMRGINEFSSNGLPNGRGTGMAGYQGLDETDTSFMYYDMVYMETNGVRTYYYCKNGDGATQHTPGASGSDSYWVEATNFDFIATRVLLAQAAHIDVMSGNGVYMFHDNAQDIASGMQGGSGINFFAGLVGGNMQNVGNCPFRVNNQGEMWATNAHIQGVVNATSGNFSGFVRMPFTDLETDYYDVVTLSTEVSYYKVKYKTLQQPYGTWYERTPHAFLPAPTTALNGFAYNILIPEQMVRPTGAYRQWAGLVLIARDSQGERNLLIQNCSSLADRRAHDDRSNVPLLFSSVLLYPGFAQLVCDGERWYLTQSSNKAEFGVGINEWHKYKLALNIDDIDID